MKKYIVEFLGAFTLTFVVAMSLANNFVVATPVLAALILGVFVYTIGSISGAHINPGVTIGLWSINKIKTSEAFFYVVAQLIGGALAGYIAYSVLGVFPNSPTMFSVKVLLAEMFGMILFTFGIASVVYGKANPSASGVVVGGSLLLGITVAAFVGSAGVLNIAVSTGLKMYNLAYIVGPILGSIIGFNLYKYVAGER